MKTIIKQVTALLFVFSVAYAAMAPDQYADYLAKTVDDVVKTIHATVPNSKITHADILAIMCVEQGSLNISKNSHAGARGLTQVMPATFRQYTRTNYGGFGDFVRRTGCTVNHLSFDVRCSIEAGARIFNYYLIKYNGDRAKAAIAYNAGPGRVGAARLPLETKEYVNYKFPKCFSRVKYGQAPFASKIWKRLVAQVSRLTNGKMALNGFASLIPYTAGTQPFAQFIADATQNPQGFLSRFFSFSQNQSAYSQSRNYQPNANPSFNNKQTQKKDPSDKKDRYSNANDEPLEISDFDFKLTDTISTNHNDSGSVKSNAFIGYEERNLLSCAPSFFEKGQAVLISFYCPAGFVSESEFSSKSYGIVKIYPSKNTEYKLKCKNENKILIKSCKVALIEPKINISKSVKTNGKIEVSWSASDVNSCTLISSGRSRNISLSGKELFNGKNELKSAKIICEAKNGIFIKKSLSDII